MVGTGVVSTSGLEGFGVVPTVPVGLNMFGGKVVIGGLDIG